MDEMVGGWLLKVYGPLELLNLRIVREFCIRIVYTQTTQC